MIKKIVPAKCYLALSMGVDSVAALHWLLSKKYQVIALHFNHNIRDQNQLMEKNFQKICSDFNLESFCGKGSNLLTESSCREARLKFYEEVVSKNSTIITAHHLNDWVENYLLNCFRGHPEHQPIRIESEFKNYKIAHPFLLTKKKDFQQYVDRNNLCKYVIEDETNRIVQGSRRNWLRNQIIPEMIKNKLSLEKFAERKIKSTIF